MSSHNPNVGTMNSTTSSSSTANRSLQNFLLQTPIFVSILLVINITIFIIGFLLTMDINPYVFQPYRVWYYSQYYRMITSAFLHGGIMHIGMNMMSLVAIGGMLEPVYGSFKFLFLTWLAILLGGICYLILAFGTAWITRDYSYIGVSSIGFSGVLFTYAVIESFNSTETTRSIFGLFSVPIKLYPFILLILLQVILPNISLFGHLGGLLAGIILMTSVGSQIFIPSQAGMEWLESILMPAFIKRQSSYKAMTTKEFVHPSLQGGDVKSIALACWRFIIIALTCVMNIFVTIAHVFGFPLDRYLQSCYESISSFGQSIYIRFCSCFGSLSEGASSAVSTAASVAANPVAHAQGYEQVPNDSNHDDVEAIGGNGQVPASDSANSTLNPLFNKPGNKLGGSVNNPNFSRIVAPKSVVNK